MLFRSGRDSVIRLLAIGSLVFLGLMVWLLSLPPPVNGPPESFGERLFVVALALVAGLALPVGLVLYGRRYVSTFALSPDGKTAIVRQVGFLFGHTRRLDVALLGKGAFHEGRLDLPRAPSVNAPWISIPVRGGPGLIVDVQGEVLDEAAWEALLERIGVE